MDNDTILNHLLDEYARTEVTTEVGIERYIARQTIRNVAIRLGLGADLERKIAKRNAA